MNIPVNLTIGDGAFWYCTALVTVTLPTSLTSIGNGAFNACPSLDAASRAGIATRSILWPGFTF